MSSLCFDCLEYASFATVRLLLMERSRSHGSHGLSQTDATIVSWQITMTLLQLLVRPHRRYSALISLAHSLSPRVSCRRSRYHNEVRYDGGVVLRQVSNSSLAVGEIRNFSRTQAVGDNSAGQAQTWSDANATWPVFPFWGDVDDLQHNVSLYLDAGRLPASESYMGSIHIRYCGGFVRSVDDETGSVEYWPCACQANTELEKAVTVKKSDRLLPWEPNDQGSRCVYPNETVSTTVNLFPPHSFGQRLCRTRIALRFQACPYPGPKSASTTKRNWRRHCGAGQPHECGLVDAVAALRG